MKPKTPNRMRRFAFSLTEVLAVAAIMAAIPSNSYQRAKEKTHQVECINNLRQIAALLQMYHGENGEFPKAAFYPADPEGGADSIRTILGGPKEIWVCPSMPDELKAKGLTFVYNDTLGGQQSFADASRKWVLIEMTCATKNAVHAHPEGYNVLFADGHIITTKQLPSHITAAHK